MNLTKIIYKLINEAFLYFFAFFLFATNAISAQKNEHEGWLYTVKKNDNLTFICAQYCIQQSNIQTLADVNHLRSAHLLSVGQTIFIPLSVLKTNAVPAKILTATGDVQIKKNDHDAFQKLNLSDSILVGTTLKTGLNSLVKLQFADRSEALLQPNSTLKIIQSHQYAGKLTYAIKLILSTGRTEILANPEHFNDHHLEVETPSAVAVVRGTQFRVSAEENNAIEETLIGNVAFSVNENAVEVGENFGSVSLNGQPPLPPKALPNPPETAQLPKIFDELPVLLPVSSTQSDIIWVAQLAKDANFTEIIDEQSTQTQAESSKKTLNYAHLMPGQYFLKLRAQDENGLQSVDAFHTFTVNPLTLLPNLIFPKDIVLDTEKTVFQWTDMPNHRGYLIQIASDAAFNHILLERIVSFNAFNLGSVFPKGEYYWRVAENLKRERSQFKFSKPAQFSF